jgi:RNA polymerase sigma-70 factor (ECF subfamily)
VVQSPADLETVWQRGRSQWPGVCLSLDEFASRLGQVEVAPHDLNLRGTDLFLAMACAAGDPAALGYFESVLLSRVNAYVARFHLSADKLDDVRQKVRIKALVGDTPGIGRYRGQAPLAVWVHVTAVRLAIDAVAPQRAQAVEVDLLDLVSWDHGPETETAKRLYGPRLQAALEGILRSLPERDQTILRFHVVEGLNVDAIGAIYGVHRATVARWLVAIRARVFDKLKQEFAVGWKASSSELRSLVSLLRDYIDITAKRILAPGA